MLGSDGQKLDILTHTFTIMSSRATKGISVRSVTLPTIGSASTCAHVVASAASKLLMHSQSKIYLIIKIV